jgi:hypothetical protein
MAGGGGCWGDLWDGKSRERGAVQRRWKRLGKRQMRRRRKRTKVVVADDDVDLLVSLLVVVVVMVGPAPVDGFAGDGARFGDMVFQFGDGPEKEGQITASTSPVRYKRWRRKRPGSLK